MFVGFRPYFLEVAHDKPIDLNFLKSRIFRIASDYLGNGSPLIIIIGFGITIDVDFILKECISLEETHFHGS